MIEQLILVGNGGCMHEIAWQIELLNKEKPVWQISGFVDKNPSQGYHSYPWLGDDEYLLSKTEDVNAAICVGNPVLRKKIAEKLSVNPHIKFPVLVLNDRKCNGDTEHIDEAVIADSSTIGKGSIICMNSIISTDTHIGEFVFLNIGSMVCHDGIIEDYVTLSPDVKLAGNVHIKQGTEIGIGAKVIQGITIGEYSTIGAGAVVVRDIPSDCTAVGVPAKPIKTNNRMKIKTEA